MGGKHTLRFCRWGRETLALESEGGFTAEPPRPDVYVVQFGGQTKVKAAQLINELRSAGMQAELDYMDRSVKAQFKSANRINAKWVLILGEEELAAGKVKLRNMDDGTEELIDLSNIIQHMQSREE